MTRPEVEAARAARDGFLPARVALEPRQIEYLALEGGGGKGLAYLGALEALEALGGMKRLKGCAGASAGAITALLITLGYDAKALRDYLTTADFTRFFDPATPRLRPTVGAPYANVEDDPSERFLLQRFKLSGLGLIPPVLRELADVSDDGEGRSIGEALGRHAQKQPYKGLLEEHDKYVAYLSADMGLFSGKAARDEFDALIRKAIRTKYPDMPADELDRRPAITFKDLKDLDFKLDLVLTGSNLATGRTELFSSRHTPAFPVADAVRISMSLPFVYKPYVITASPEGFPPCGTYVDGGLWNNLPYRDASVSGPRSTLSLRLEIVPPVRVQTIGDLLSRVATFGLFGTGESQVLRAYEVNMITLDTRGLDLIDFSPPVEPREQAIKRAARTVYLAFGQIPPVQYRDLRDDMASAQLRGASNVCGPGRLADVVP